jgi:hypothetical protein
LSRNCRKNGGNEAEEAGERLMEMKPRDRLIIQKVGTTSCEEYSFYSQGPGEALEF